MLSLKIKKVFTRVSIFISVILFFAANKVFAVDPYGLNTTANAANISTTSVDIPTRVGLILGVVLSMVGVVFLVLMVMGGIIWMTAAGEPDKIKKAKGLIVNALIGMVIIASGYIITNFVLTQILTATK